MRQDSGRHLARPTGRGRAGRSSAGRSIAFVALIMVVVLAGGFGAYLLVNRSSSGAACGSGRLALQVVADPDQAGLLKRVAGDYASTTPAVGDRCVDVAVRALDSPEATAALAAGWADPNLGPRPDVWVPASSLWASELDLQLQAVDQPSPLPADRPSVATSPLVVAMPMPMPMAQALGWPRQALGWSSLVGTLRNPAGWRAFGHPEWGQFKLGKTDPRLSEAGLGALLAAALAMAGHGKPITLAELASKAPELGLMILEVSRSPRRPGRHPKHLARQPGTRR
jgi:Ca-activated chloride channel homolog